MFSKILCNGGILIVPALAISFGLWKYLPTPYGQEEFSRGIPHTLEVFENGFRVLIFVMPVFLLWGSESSTQRLGWVLYASGLVLYAGSYIAQIASGSSAWSTSVIGFSAPAWTPIFWLYGIAFICDRSWLLGWWRGYIYGIAATAFVVLHTYHAVLVHSRLEHA